MRWRDSCFHEATCVGTLGPFCCNLHGLRIPIIATCKDLGDAPLQHRMYRAGLCSLTAVADYRSRPYAQR